MKKWLQLIGSLKLTVILLVIILVALAVGTIIESRQSTEAARAVYYAAWFRLLLGVFAVNLIASLVGKWPWDRQHIGFAVTHCSMLVVLLGSLMTYQLKIDAQLALWEGQQSSEILERVASGEPAVRSLPFSVRLDSFEIDYYPGTRRPAMFRSRVVVNDPQVGISFPAVIEMNRELSYGGYNFYQSSYQIAGGREMTVLSVSRDPGQVIVFLGYVLLMIGMVTVLSTRIAQRRAFSPEAVRKRKQAKKPARATAWLPILLVGAAIALAGPPLAHAAEPIDTATLETLRRIPVQHDGRAMPLDTLAREAVWTVTGRSSWQGQDPVATILGWSFDAEAASEPLVRVGGAELASEVGLPPGTERASFRQLAESARLLDLFRQARERAENEEPLTPVLEDARDLEGRLIRLQGFLNRQSLRVVPIPGQPMAAWSVPHTLSEPADLIAVYYEQRAGIADHYPVAGDMEREITYNRVRPSRLAWWILLPATLLSLVAWLRPQRWLDVVAVAGLLAGFGVMTWGLAARWQIAGRIPASNMYESLLFLGWGVGLFALVASLFLRNRLVIFDATAMSTVTMMLTDLLPIDGFIHPMPPVLSGTPWLAIHVPIIMVSYSVFALGVLVAHMQIGIEIFTPGRRELAARMSDTLYWYMHVGSILLAAGILTGSIWAASSWGRYWGWDPKEVWSLIALLAYMAILHGRFDRIIGPFGVAAASIGAFWAILMTYLGVNFVLTAGLHSYGFGGGPVVRWMSIVAIAEIAFLATGFVAYRRNRRAGGGLTVTS